MGIKASNPMDDIRSEVNVAQHGFQQKYEVASSLCSKLVPFSGYQDNEFTRISTWVTSGLVDPGPINSIHICRYYQTIQEVPAGKQPKVIRTQVQQARLINILWNTLGKDGTGAELSKKLAELAIGEKSGVTLPLPG